MRAVPAQKKLVLLDTFQAGGAAKGEMLVAMRGGEEIDTIERLARAEGVAIVAAAMEKEVALEVAELLSSPSTIRRLESCSYSVSPLLTRKEHTSCQRGLAKIVLRLLRIDGQPSVADGMRSCRAPS